MGAEKSAGRSEISAVREKAVGNRPRLRQRLGRAALVLALMSPSLAWAAEPSAEDKAGARAAATAGADAFEQGKFAEALDFFKRAESIIHSPVHELYMARSEVQLGQLVAARELFLKVKRENKDADATRRFAEQAEAELGTLEPRIPQITVKIEGAEAKDTEITVDGRPFRTVLLGIPQPFDPGKHEFSAVAQGGAFEGKASLELAESAQQTLVLKLVATGKPPVVAEPGAPAPTGSKEPTLSGEPQTEAAPAEDKTWMRYSSYGALGLGAGGVALGVVFGLTAQSKAQEADELCEEETGSVGCEGASNSVQRDVEALDGENADAVTISTIGFIAGGVLLGTGVTLFLLSSDSGGSASETAQARTPTGIRVTPVLSPNYLGLRGSF